MSICYKNCELEGDSIMPSLGFETLIEKNEYANRWYPNSVETYKDSIIINGDYDTINKLKSNFAYNMQYIEYLEKQISELKLSSVLSTMLYKSYIITSMGIIEALFVNLLHSTNNWNTTVWKEIGEVKSNPKVIMDKKIMCETHIFKECDEYDMRMDLDSMIKKIEKKNLLSIEHSDFPALKKLRELRNRVHLQIGDDSHDHDYNCFNLEQIQMSRRILYSVLTSDEFCNNAGTFEFLKERYEIYSR